MSSYVPNWVGQLDGSPYAGLNCNCAVGAMALDRSTLGAKRTTGNGVRIATGDKKGGTTQRQVAEALEDHWGIELDVRTTGNTIPPSTAVKRLDKGMGMMLAGQSSATRGTKWSASETFGGNHQWWDNERRKNSQVAGGYEHRILDPLGNGRRDLADFTHGGLWIPQAVVIDFARRLNISNTPDQTYVPLGYGRWYAVFTRDTEPHFELKYGAKATTATRHINVPAGRLAIVRSGPGRKYRDVLHLKDGARFIYYQATTGQSIAGNPHWYGNIDGSRWVHASALV